MKNINPSRDQYEKHKNPFLVSEPSDCLRLIGENRLRMLAMTIPSHGHHQLETTTQGCISATIHATQEFLSQLVSGLALTNPSAARHLVVSSSGLDAIDWLDRTRDSEHGWLPNYPVSGYITRGTLSGAPHFGRSPLEAAVTLQANRSNDTESDDFLVHFSVAEAEDMRHLSMLMDDAGDLWDEFENTFGVTPFTSIPLPEDVESQSDKRESCRNYATAFVEYVVAKDDGDSCLETFDLEFTIKQKTPLHEPIVAAIALLNAFSLYQYSIQTMNRDNCHSKALEELESAIRTGSS